MFKGLYTTGDEMMDRLVYTIIAILAMEVFIFVGMPLLEMALSMNWVHPFF